MRPDCGTRDNNCCSSCIGYNAILSFSGVAKNREDKEDDEEKRQERLARHVVEKTGRYIVRPGQLRGLDEARTLLRCIV